MTEKQLTQLRQAIKKGECPWLVELDGQMVKVAEELMKELDKYKEDANRLHGAIARLVYLHSCEQEALILPQPEQWIEVVKEAGDTIAALNYPPKSIWLCGKCDGGDLLKHTRHCPFAQEYVDEGQCPNCDSCDGAPHSCAQCETRLTANQCEEWGGVCTDCARLLS